MRWFGFKKKTDTASLYEMAHKLHLERRLHPRVRMPRFENSFGGPAVLFENAEFPILDVSEGGVCLIDDQDLMRSKVGQKFSMTFAFSDTDHSSSKFEVSAKLVASNLNKKHIQFENPPLSFVETLRPWISMGLRGIWMKDLGQVKNDTSPSSPARFKLFLASILDDALISSTDMRWEFELSLKGNRYCISLSNWPCHFERKSSVSKEEFDLILTFFSNIDEKLLEGHGDLLKKLGEIRQNANS